MRSNRTLDGLFDTMRDERAVADGAIERLVEQVAASTATRQLPWKSIGLAALLGSLTLGVAGLMISRSGEDATWRSPSNSKRGVASSMRGVVATGDTSRMAETVFPDSAQEGRGAERQGLSDGGSRAQAPGERGARELARTELAVTRTDTSNFGRSAREKWKEYLQRSTSDLVDAPVQATLEVEGSNVIRLQQRDLAAIGVRVNSDGVVECYARTVAFMRSSHHADTVEQVDTRLSLLPGRGRTIRVRAEDVPHEVEPTVLPELITDGAGYAYLFDSHARTFELPAHVQRLRDSIERRRLARPRDANALIAVRVQGASLAIDGGDDNDIILWYPADPRFIALLPPCLREQLVSELDSIAGLRAGALDQSVQRMRVSMSPELRSRFDSMFAAMKRTPKPCTEPVVGRPLLDIWRSSAGAVSAAWVTPNSIAQTAQLTIELSDERSVQVWLHTIDGEQLRSLTERTSMPSGRSTLAIDVAGVPPGLYLLVVGTDQGERAVLRVIVQ